MGRFRRMSSPDLAAAGALVDCADTTIAAGADALRRAGGPDVSQVLAYDLAHAAAAATTARVMLDYGAKGDTEAAITCAFAADVVHDLLTRIAGRQQLWGADLRAFDAVLPTLERYRDPEFVATLAETPGPLHLDDDMDMVRDTFRSFAANVVAPHAEHVHRTNGDVPEDVITGLAELGAFGLSVPAEYGGFSEGGDREYLAMVVATEELSRASLGIGGSLITRPEILTRALIRGGTEAQKQHWLPQLASGEVMVAVAVTEPDFGSDVAGLKVTADTGRWRRRRAGLRHQRGEDLVHVRRAGRRADAARPHRSRPRQSTPRAEPVHRPQAGRRRARLRVQPGRRR